MKKLILILFTAIAFINVQAQCNSNPISDNGASGTVNFSDSSSVTPGWSTNYSVSYLWAFGDGTTSTQQNPCHTYGDLSNVSFPLYATLTVTYFDSTTINYCIDTDSVQVYILMNPCVYGDLQISASGANLSANWTYNIGGSSGCANNYLDTYLWSNGDTTQTISVNSPGTYTCTVTLQPVVYIQAHMLIMDPLHQLSIVI
jgi:PKD repeat protein